MTINRAKTLKDEFFEILEDFEKNNRFRIYRACSHLASTKRTIKDAAVVTNLFFELVEKLRAKGWVVPFEIYINEGILFIGKETSEIQFNTYIDENGIGIFGINKDNLSLTDVIEVSEKELKPISNVITLLRVIVEARKQSENDGYSVI